MPSHPHGLRRPAFLSMILAGTAIAAPALSGEPTVLPTVSVTANRAETPAAAVGSAVTVVTGEELEQRQTRILSDVLREVPGVAVNRAGPLGAQTQVRIRGSEANQTLVIIDGIELNDPSSGSEYDFANLLAGDIERFEVLRGPQSALYGSDAIGGVIDITTRRGRGKPSLDAAIEGGSVGTMAGRAAVGAGSDRWDVRASIQGVTSQGISVADERNGNSEKDGYRNGTATAKLNVYPTETTEIGVVGRHTRSRVETDNFAGGVGAVDDIQNTVGRQSYGRVHGRATLFGGMWEHIAGASYSLQEREYQDASDTVTSTYEGRRSKLDYQTNLNLATGPATHVITAAAEHEEEKAVTRSNWSNFDRQIGSTGLVGQYRLGLFERLYVSGSVRHDANDLFDDANTWRTTAAYTVHGPETKLRFSYGTGVKNPTLFELYGYTPTYHGNPDLKPEKARGWDAGFDQPLWSGRAIVDATYFRQRIEDLITGTGTTAVNMSGTSKVNGVELGVTVEPLAGLRVRGSYTFTDGEDANGSMLVRRPRHLASLNVNYRFLDDRANANLGIAYNGEQDDWAYDASYNRSVVKLAPYTLVSLSGGYKLTDTVELFGRVENLLNQQYQEVYTYGSPGRAGYVGLRLAL